MVIFDDINGLDVFMIFGDFGDIFWYLLQEWNQMKSNLGYHHPDVTKCHEVKSPKMF